MKTQHVGHLTDYRREPKTETYCCICQRDIKDQAGKPQFSVHLVEGGPVVLHPSSESEYASDGGDLGLHRVGPECARKIGKDWCHVTATA